MTLRTQIYRIVKRRNDVWDIIIVEKEGRKGHTDSRDRYIG